MRWSPSRSRWARWGRVGSGAQNLNAPLGSSSLRCSSMETSYVPSYAGLKQSKFESELATSRRLLVCGVLFCGSLPADSLRLAAPVSRRVSAVEAIFVSAAQSTLPMRCIPPCRLGCTRAGGQTGSGGYAPVSARYESDQPCNQRAYLMHCNPHPPAEAASFLAQKEQLPATGCSLLQKPHTMRLAHAMACPSVWISWQRSHGKRLPQQGKRNHLSRSGARAVCGGANQCTRSPESSQADLCAGEAADKQSCPPNNCHGTSGGS
jgi:hypothetical protein